MKNVFFEYLEINKAKLFTVVCLPQSNNTFPTIIMRSPYVDSTEFLAEEAICENKLKEYKTWLDNG